MARAIRTDTPERISRPARNLAAADAYQAMHEPRLHRGPAGLTQREVEVLRLLARGLSNDAIAEQLVIAPKRRSGNHIEHVFAKTGASTRAAAGRFAMQHGLLPEEEFPARPQA
jgi:DNA-binding NarL/FixJ family response regulator